MENEASIQEGEFLRRMTHLVRAVGIGSRFWEDLTQETWLRCREYAGRCGRPVHLLSDQEIRYRCLEARRKVLPDRREVIGFLEGAEEPLLPNDSPKISLLEELLSFHPALRLTPLQRKLWSVYREDPDGRWKADLAKNLGCSRQNIANITGTIRKKIADAAELVHLLEGDLLPFFEKSNTGWAPPPVRHLLWSVLRPKSGDPVSPLLASRFAAIEAPMVELAVRVIETENRNVRLGAPLDSKKFTLAYNLLISAIHIRPDGVFARHCLDELTAKIPARSWVLYRMVRRVGHLVSDRLREAHQEWLKERIRRRDQEGLHFAAYGIAYYAGTPLEEAGRFLEGDGKTGLRAVCYEPVLQRLYDNIQIPRYNSSAVWMDINFLRLALMEAYFPLVPLSGRARNTLTILCQKSLHSSDPFVVSHAERLLRDQTHAFVERV